MRKRRRPSSHNDNRATCHLSTPLLRGPVTHHTELDEDISTAAKSPTYVPRYTEFDIIQQNLQGTGKDKYKLDTLASQCITSKRNQIYLIQETKIAGSKLIKINEEDDNKNIQTCTFFLHGNDERERKAGVGIMLGPEATKAWKEMGSPDPTRITCAGAGRIIGIPIHFNDKHKRKTKFYLISAHLLIPIPKHTLTMFMNHALKKSTICSTIIVKTTTPPPL